MNEARWTELARRATRKLVLLVGLIGSLALSLPLELALFHWPLVAEHVAFQVTAAALLAEALFWMFDKVPFTCSYYPGRKSLALLIVLYVYGITEYSFNMADLENALAKGSALALLVLLAGCAALILAWRHRQRAEAVRFDGSEPVIQSLELN